MAAGNELCRRFAGRLRRFFGSKVPPQDVDELLQQTWLALTPEKGGVAIPATAQLRTPPTIRTTFRAYLFGIARFVVLRYHRANCRSHRFDPEVDSMDALVPSLSRQLSLKRHVKRLELALQSLPLELQLLAEARYVEQLSGPELAAMFEMPEGTIRSRLARVRRLLDEALAVSPPQNDQGPHDQSE